MTQTSKAMKMKMMSRKIKKKFKGWEARIFQHEYDHLEGILFPDRADSRTFCTWKEFAERYQAGVEKAVRQVVDQWGE